MDANIFKAGTSGGSPDNYSEIKILILYCLDCAKQGVSFEALHEALREHELVNYFALIESVEQLVSLGHIERVTAKENQSEILAATTVGENTAKELYTILPRSIQEKGKTAIINVLKKQKRLSEVNIKEETVAGGIMLEFSIPDMDSDIFSIKLFAPNKAEASLLKKSFLNDPVFIYNAVMALMTGDAKILNGIFPSKEKLF